MTILTLVVTLALCGHRFKATTMERWCIVLLEFKTTTMSHKAMTIVAFSDVFSCSEKEFKYAKT